MNIVPFWVYALIRGASMIPRSGGDAVQFVLEFDPSVPSELPICNCGKDRFNYLQCLYAVHSCGHPCTGRWSLTRGAWGIWNIKILQNSLQKWLLYMANSLTRIEVSFIHGRDAVDLHPPASTAYEVRVPSTWTRAAQEITSSYLVESQAITGSGKVIWGAS